MPAERGRPAGVEPPRVPLVTFTTGDDGVGRITLNDPERLNAMSPAMAEAFEAAVRDASRVRPLALVVRGEGRAFSAGGDLAMLEERRRHGLSENRAYMLDFYRAFLSLRDLGMPLVAALHGHCVGAGACLAMACDLRVAADDCRIAFSFTRLGLHPGLGITWFLPRVAGTGVAADLLLTGRTVDAAEALRLGLVGRVVAAPDLRAQADALAAGVARNGPQATQLLLATLRQTLPGLPQALQAEATAQAVNYGSEEFAEGMAAVRERREPRFGGKSRHPEE